MNFENLPFVIMAQNGKVKDTWRVVSTGDYDQDCALGRKHFRALMLVMNATSNPLYLVRVIEGQAAKYATWGGIEAGFLSAMSDELSSL
jgi:hypothetical protein